MPMVTSKKQKKTQCSQNAGVSQSFSQGIPIQEMHIPLQDHKVTRGPWIIPFRISSTRDVELHQQQWKEKIHSCFVQPKICVKPWWSVIGKLKAKFEYLPYISPVTLWNVSSYVSPPLVNWFQKKGSPVFWGLGGISWLTERPVSTSPHAQRNLLSCPWRWRLETWFDVGFEEHVSSYVAILSFCCLVKGLTVNNLSTKTCPYHLLKEMNIIESKVTCFGHTLSYFPGR